MGTKGRRYIDTKSLVYTEPDLLLQVNDVLNAAKKCGYEDERGNVDLRKIAEHFNIEIREETDMESSQSGYLHCTINKCVIGVNKKHPEARRRYTIAHELGHFFLHKNDGEGDFSDEVFFRISSSSPMEYAANEFAAKILMPEDRVRNCIEKKHITQLTTLSNYFNVSLEAMKYRLEALGYILK